MDLGKIVQEELGQVLSNATSSTPKKKAKLTSPTTDALGSLEDSVDTAIKSKLPKGAVTDFAENALDQDKDGHVVDDLLHMGESLISKKK